MPSNMPHPITDDEMPICVDLDGTLVKTDVLVEGILAILASGRQFSRLPELVSFSRADFKRRVSKCADLRADLLPYNAELISFLRQKKRAGRQLVLVTA